MIKDKKIVVVLPAYNASMTLEKTYNEIPFDIVDEVVLVDDMSKDDTVQVATRIGIKHIIEHKKNTGYGGNQKSCYNKALELNADIVIMLHPDYQYTPYLIQSMAYIIANDLYPVVFGSRILGKGALNILLNQKLSEYHTGYRAFSKEVLETVDYEANNDDFIFDNEMISQIFMAGFDIAEITCPTKYFPEASSINFSRSMKYGLGVLRVSFNHFFYKMGLHKSPLYKLKK
jgi:glycosyltransferase involved in cell wall biosynthesis